MPTSTIQSLLSGLAEQKNGLPHEGRINAILETLPDFLRQASKSALTESFQQANDTLHSLKAVHDVQDEDPAFLAGRISAIVDILGYTADRTTSEEWLSTWEKEENLPGLKLLAEKPRSAEELDHLFKDHLARDAWLTEMIRVQALWSYNSGLRQIYQPTPACITHLNL